MASFAITTLGKAAAKGRTDLVKKFLEEGQDPEKPDTQGLTPLQHAANKGYFDIVKILVEKAEVDIDKRKKGGFNALMYAVFHNHHEIASYLLDNGAITSCSADEYSPLHYVIMNDKKSWAKDILALMLKTGASPNCIDKLNQTPLEHSFHRKNAEIMKMLVRSGADPSRRDKHGLTILHRMVSTEDFAFQDRLAIISVILKSGIDPNIADRDGKTPLHMAALLKDKQGLEIASLLIEHGASPQARDANGHTPFDIAQHKGNPKMESFLQDF